MQIVIELSEQDYQLACKYPDVLIAVYAHVIKNGTPLPEGHGELKDADKICGNIISALGIKDESFLMAAEKTIYRIINDAPTIIEADKGGTE